jgi:Calcineurin-like phosphoesterase
MHTRRPTRPITTETCRGFCLRQTPEGLMAIAAFAAIGVLGADRAAFAAVTYKPYVQLGSAGRFGPTDQMVIAWQTDETTPSVPGYSVEFETRGGAGGSVLAVGRVVDNYLAADPALPIPTTATGPRVDYYAVLSGLEYDTEYAYRVRGAGLPGDGFRASFHTRKRSGDFSFLVEGDEGFFPAEAGAQPARLADFEARIVHLMNNVPGIHLRGERRLPEPDLLLNTGDNVYTFGSEGNYRDFWFPVWNSDVDSNETGAPFIRRKPVYIVAGNHDIGSTGVNVNLLATDTAARFTGNQDGGDALAYYNNYYYPLNGPTGVDPQISWNADTATANGFFFRFLGVNYTSPAAIEALRASTTVVTGANGAAARQIDHMSNYSFDSGNAHFLFLDANPHLFDGILDGAPVYAATPDQFTSYPSVLRKWIIDDLDGSDQTWKVVVFHQPAFSSGLATLRNSQMRAIAKVLEDHGVNIVFNGHEHNYQRTLPLRALSSAADAASPSGAPAVDVDPTFDGVWQTVPDGVLYVVEGAGGNRDFDGDEGPARGSGLGLDEDDSATGSFALTPTLTVAQGPAAWLDTHLTDEVMTPLFAGAGSGPKITARFKAKIFSFAQVVVDEDRLTLFQITEPLQNTSSATPQSPAPFGTDVDGSPLNDPIPDTLVDPATGAVVSAPATGTPALLDEFTVTKADLGSRLVARVSGPPVVARGSAATFDVDVVNASGRALNGTQVVFTPPEGTEFAGTADETTTVHGRQVVVTLGRLEQGARATIGIPVTAISETEVGVLAAHVVLRSSTARPVSTRAIHVER